MKDFTFDPFVHLDFKDIDLAEKELLEALEAMAAAARMKRPLNYGEFQKEEDEKTN